jgi:Tfp pilus assembly protein PilF
MYAGVETLWQATLRLNPDSWMAHDNLGNIFAQQGLVDEAIRQYRETLQIKPDSVEAHNNLGNALLKKARVDEAITHFQNALQINPDYVNAHVNLGIALLQKGKVDEAIIQYQKALQINPGHGMAHNNLGNILLQQGKAGEAIAHFQKALQLKPADASIQNNLAWLLATSAEAPLRDGNKAVALARQANELTGGENPVILNTLAAAYAEAGRFAEALETARRALALAGAQSNSRLAGQLQYEMKLYQAGSPFHIPEQTH